MPLHLLDIQNLASQRKNGLCIAVASLLGRATCRVTLDKEYLACLRILVGTVGKFSRQSSSCHHALALHALASLTCGDTCRCGENHLLAYLLGLSGMFLKIVCQCLVDSLLYGSLHLAVAELGLGLSLELWFGNLYGDYCSKTLTEILGGNIYLSLLNLLGNGGIGLSVGFERTGESHAETCQMGTALDGVDVVYVRMNVFRVVGVVHYRNLDRYVVLLCLQIDYIIEEMLAVTVYVAYEFL